MGLSDIQKLKRNFRNSKKWKELRHRKNVEQKGIDPVTLGKLNKTCNLHHLNLDEEQYCNLSNEDNFVMLNKQTHEVVHWLWRYYCKDESVLLRLKEVLDKMKELN